MPEGLTQTEPPTATHLLPVADDPDPAELCSCTTTSLTFLAGEIVVLRVVGEVDSFTLPLVRSALTESLDRRPAYLIVDMSGLTFCDVGGLGQLVLTGVAASKRGTGYAVSGCPARLSRLWSIIWGADVPMCYRSVPAALAAIRFGEADERTDTSLCWSGEAFNEGVFVGTD